MYRLEKMEDILDISENNFDCIIAPDQVLKYLYDNRNMQDTRLDYHAIRELMIHYIQESFKPNTGKDIFINKESVKKIRNE